jgi:hypothetical protein
MIALWFLIFKRVKMKFGQQGSGGAHADFISRSSGI